MANNVPYQALMLGRCSGCGRETDFPAACVLAARGSVRCSGCGGIAQVPASTLETLAAMIGFLSARPAGAMGDRGPCQGTEHHSPFYQREEG